MVIVLSGAPARRTAKRIVQLLNAPERGHSEIRGERGGRGYQCRIKPDRSVLGTVLPAFDVTQQVWAEQDRRQFIANVSHDKFLRLSKNCLHFS